MTRVLKHSMAALALAAVTVGCSNDGRATRSTTTTTSTTAATVDGSAAPTAAPTTPAAAADGAYTSVITDEVVDDPALDAFEQKVTGLAEQVGLPGVSLLVVQHGVLVEQEAWGEYDLDKIVPIASGSKWFTAATIMSLVDEGLIDLDEPISTYVPELEQLRNKVGTITMRQLLSFTSGLVADAKLPCYSTGDVSLQECAAQFARAGVVHDPGAAFRYGGQHMFMAGAVAEIVTGVPFAELFQQRVAVPLGMAHTGFVQTASGGQVENVTHTTPAGGAISTLGDYGRFLEMIVHDGVAPDGTRILEAATVAEMQENQIEGAEYMTASAFRVERESPYGLGEWLDWTDENGEALVLSSDGAFGFRPWIDKVNDLYGVYLIVDTGEGYVEGDPFAPADDGGKVHTSGGWVFSDVAEALGGSLPAVFYPDRG